MYLYIIEKKHLTLFYNYLSYAKTNLLENEMFYLALNFFMRKIADISL